MRPNSARITLVAVGALLMLVTLAGCKPDNIFISIENGSGGTLHHVKLTYPGNDLSVSTLDISQTVGGFRHFDGPGALTVSYTTEDGHDYSSSGPEVTGNEKGDVKVRIDGSYASFDTKLEESKE